MFKESFFMLGLWYANFRDWCAKIIFKHRVRNCIMRKDTWSIYRQSIEYGYLDMVELLVQDTKNQGGNIDWNNGMIFAAQKGHRDIIDFFISKGADDWTMGLKYAAYGGHQHVIDFFVSKGANNWTMGMIYAAYGGHQHVIDFFVSKGANDWTTGMAHAAYGGHQSIVDFFVSKQTSHQFPDYIGSDICTICYDPDPRNLIILNCNHVFHQECYKVSHILCPLCKLGIKTNK